MQMFSALEACSGGVKEDLVATRDVACFLDCTLSSVILLDRARRKWRRLKFRFKTHETNLNLIAKSYSYLIYLLYLRLPPTLNPMHVAQ